MTPTLINAILAKIGGTANKRLGQHFLIDKKALEVILETAEIKKDDRVLEIGPGLGVLTRELIKRGANVIAIEKDRRFENFLTPFIKGERGILIGDAAKLDWDLIVSHKPWKFVSNLPYAITSLALRKALYAKHPPSVIVVLVQREVAERVLMRDGKMSLLALMVALASTDTKIIRRVLAGAFYPPPKVESAILKIVPSSQSSRVPGWGIDPEQVMQVAKQGFAYPRKLLFRNLGLDVKAWTEIAQKFGINIKARAEDFSVQQWVNLALEFCIRKGSGE